MEREITFMCAGFGASESGCFTSFPRAIKYLYSITKSIRYPPYYGSTEASFLEVLVAAELIGAATYFLKVYLPLAPELIARCVVTKSVEVFTGLVARCFYRILRFARRTEIEFLLRTTVKVDFLRTVLDTLKEKDRPAHEQNHDDGDRDATGYDLPLVFGAFFEIVYCLLDYHSAILPYVYLCGEHYHLIFFTDHIARLDREFFHRLHAFSTCFFLKYLE